MLVHKHMQAQTIAQECVQMFANVCNCVMNVNKWETNDDNWVMNADNWVTNVLQTDNKRKQKSKECLQLRNEYL
jgi:hypothetical protein